MLKCKACGFPKMHRYFAQWNDNGTITLRLQEDFRIVLIEADFFTKLITAIEDELDLPVRRMAFEAQRDAGKAVVDADLAAFGSLGRKWPFKHLTIRFLDNMAAWTGQGYSHTMDYRPGASSGGIIRNPFDRDLMAAVIVGAMESLEGVPYKHRWEKKGADDYIFVEADPGQIKHEEYLTVNFKPIKPGHHRLERCPRCHAPLAMRDLKWVEDEGVMMDLRKGVRMVFLDFYSCQVVLEKLSRELGPDFTPFVVDTQRAFFIRHIWEEFLSSHRGVEQLPKHELYDQVLETLALRGQGNPVEHSIEGGRFSVTIENPFNEHLLAGFLSALYECSEGMVPEVRWEWADEQTLRYELGLAG